LRGLIDYVRGVKLYVLSEDHFIQLLHIFQLDHDPESAEHAMFENGYMFYSTNGGEWHADNIADEITCLYKLSA
jgi:hypothetical protein